MASPERPPGAVVVVPPMSASVATLAGVLLTEQTVEGILQMLVTLACSGMIGVDGASISLLRTKKFETNTSTSDQVAEADAVQYDSGKGPCVEASQGHQVNIGLAATRDRWPEFSEAALARGFCGVLSSPLSVREQSIGSLNLYSRSHDLFDPGQQAAARVFAGQASVVLSNAAAYARSELVNDQLREALNTRDLIGQAKGILMARQACTADEAFDILRRRSQHTNTKLRDVAVEFVLDAAPGTQGPG